MRYYALVAGWLGFILITVVLSFEIFGWRFFSLVSNSMAPQINPGSLVAVHRMAEYGVGDVISFYTEVGGKEVIVAHRVTAIGGNVYVTKGDANQVADRLLVLPRLVIGKVVVVVPWAGYLIGLTNTRVGTFLVIIIPAALILMIEFERILNLWPRVMRRF